MNDLYTRYKKEIIQKLVQQLHITNLMAVPRLEKIVVSCGLGEALTDKKVIDKMVQQLAIITGQKPQVTHARKSISTFKLREGDAIGLKVTLRKKKMYDFFTRLVTIALPRVRDFRGVPTKGFDGRGNYTLGIAEQTIFPELDYSIVDKIRGFAATFVTTASSDQQAKALLEALGMPFEKG
ncbi:MAG: 50S ribosomal protein L5 [Patescibacteria group bacterium]|nr:50S ribosomal protein L5 [Patescibacteria group bacterium]